MTSNADQKQYIIDATSRRTRPVEVGQRLPENKVLCVSMIDPAETVGDQLGLLPRVLRATPNLEPIVDSMDRSIENKVQPCFNQQTSASGAEAQSVGQSPRR